MDKLTYEQVNKLCKLRPQAIVTVNYEVGGEMIPVRLKNTLSLTDMSAFLNYVVLGCFDQDEYIPEYQELIIFAAVLKFLSNIPLPELLDSGLVDLAKLHKMLDAMDLLTRIRAMYNSKDEDERRLWKLFDRLDCMVLEKLEFRRQQVASK